MAAWNLTRQGMRVLMLDAGTKFPRSQFWSHVKPWQVPEKIAAGQKPPQFYVDLKTAPYQTPPGQPFDLVRVWGRGGKTNIWGRVSLRYSDLDFTGAERDGWEIPWPIRYKDIAPYYDKVDQLIGVCGGDDDQDSLPGSRYHLPPPAPRCGERLLQKAARNIGISIVAGRRAVLTRPHNGHAACHYCGACGKGCDVGAFFNSSDYLIEPAFGTGTPAGDRQRRGGARADRRRRPRQRRAVLRPLHEGGAHRARARGGGGGVLHRFHAHSAELEIAPASERHRQFVRRDRPLPERAGSAAHVRLRAGTARRAGAERRRHRRRARLHAALQSSRRPQARLPARLRHAVLGLRRRRWTPVGPRQIPGFGADFKTAVRKRYPALVALHPYGEVLPYADNRITVDGAASTITACPIARIEFKYRENERKMMTEMYQTAAAILKAAKAEILPYDPTFMGIPGQAIHEHSTCRMGADPKRSALNGFCQMHDVKNVFVVDGAAFTTASEKNPTLTILALAWRATDYLAGEMKAKRL